MKGDYMKKIALAAILALFSVSGIAVAGDAHGKNPHGAMAGGCESKAKIARLKEKYGENWAKIVKKHSMEQKAQSEHIPKKEMLNQFI